eukprot:TRINITY_DN21807_c0_g1_i1.p1 TRINITY_DN21807_c0_g1~~TRINITY_DN21807_c0_g1_i1.p1  ORF type:complete len:572 (-),score=108.15 TRINITY_DN21807_c0_g1_i1:48-1763(-)
MDDDPGEPAAPPMRKVSSSTARALKPPIVEPRGLREDVRYLLSWLEQNIHARLSDMDHKLDTLVAVSETSHRIPGFMRSGRDRPVPCLGDANDVTLTRSTSKLDVDVSNDCRDVDVSFESHREEMEVAPPESKKLVVNNSTCSTGITGVQACTFPSEESGDAKGTLSSRENGVEPMSASERERRMSRYSTGPQRDSLGTVDSQNPFATVKELTDFIESRKRNQYVDFIWRVLEDPESNSASVIYDWTMRIAIFLSVVTACLVTLDWTPFGSRYVSTIIETIFECLFFVDIGLRFLVSPKYHKFFVFPYNVVDVISVLPLIFRAILQFRLPDPATCESLADCSFLLGLVPLLRLLKMMRHFQKFNLLTKAFYQAAEVLPVLVFFYLVLLFLCSSVLYIVEPRDNLETFSRACWLAFVSMTTVGYGETTPVTDVGRITISIMVFLTGLYMAIPVGILGNAFNDVWKERHRILILDRTRTVLEQCGIGLKDVPKLFRIFDVDQNGEIDRKEFEWMLEGMNLGLTQKRMMDLWSVFDEDGSGGIDQGEFMETLFPGKVEKMSTASGDDMSEKSSG